MKQLMHVFAKCDHGIDDNIVYFQLVEQVRNIGWKYHSDTKWWSMLRDKVSANAKISKVN